MLLDMDNFTGTISPAVHSTTSIVSLTSNDNLASKAQEAPRTPRTHLHPMTNMNDTHGHVHWDRHALVHPIKQWPQYNQYQYSSPQSLKNHPASNVLGTSPGDQHQNSISCTTVRPSFPSNVGVYDGKAAPYSSPIQSGEDLQWQMYLTASLSNPLNSLEFADPHSSPLMFPSDIQGPGGIDPSFQMDSTLFPSTNSSAFHPCQNADIFNSIPFIESPSQISSGFPSSYNLSSTQRPHTLDDSRSPAEQQDTSSLNQNIPIVDSNGCYASLLGFTPLAELTFVSSTFTSPDDEPAVMASSSPVNSSPARGRSQTIAPRSSDHRGERGLCGWESNHRLKAPSTAPSLSNIQRKRHRSTSASPSATIRRSYGLSPLSFSSSTNSEPTSATHQSKRRRQLAPLPSFHILEEEIETEDDVDNPAEDNESDDYRPSRSPSPTLAFGDDFALGFERQELKQHQSKASLSSSPTKKKSRRGKGKAKGSAALALAVVTKLGSKGLRGASSERKTLDLDELDVMTLYQEGKTGIRKRKNNPIPLPVPVPNLNKKSRGRKVPFVADLSADGARRSTSVLSVDNFNDEYEGGEERENGRENASRSMGCTRSSRKSTTPAPVVDEGGCRTYVCVIPGCGKCFVRGEHLKRHVRSIHTHDKRE